MQSYYPLVVPALAVLAVCVRLIHASIKRGRMLESLYETLMGLDGVSDRSGALIRDPVPGLPAVVAQQSKTLAALVPAVRELELWVKEHTDLHMMGIGTGQPTERRTSADRKNAQSSRNARNR